MRFGIVIPTVADADTLTPTVQRLIRSLDAVRGTVVLAVNPVDSKGAAETVRVVQALWNVPDVSLQVVDLGRPVGFAAACNAGLAAVGDADMVVFLNDDAHVSQGWLHRMWAAMSTEYVRVTGDVPLPDGSVALRDASEYGRIGLVGPVSDLVAGEQFAHIEPASRAFLDRQPEEFARQWATANDGVVNTCDFLSGFCLAIRREALADLLVPAITPEGVTHHLFDERYGVGGYEDNDLMVRAELAGWRCAIASDVFVRHVGHQTLDRHFHAAQRGLANHTTYLRKWAGHPAFAGRKLVATYRIGLTTTQDVVYLHQSLQRVARVVDGVAVVVTRNPVEVFEAVSGPAEIQMLARVAPAAYDWLMACNGADVEGVQRATEEYVQAVIASVPQSRNVEARARVWLGGWNEREERNSGIALAEEIGADWILSVDHDEMLEDRVGRADFERLMSHPDPMVRAWDFGWLNHWNTPDQVRTDRPWSDAGTFTGGMRGFRLWRVCKAAPRRILTGNEIGLHCGNYPGHDRIAIRASSLRFRHFGYLRAADRARKAEWYRRIDREANPTATGNRDGYAHLTDDENLHTTGYLPDSGIGLHMLCYRGEEPRSVAYWLDILHGLCERRVLVWTDSEPRTEEWNALASMFGAEWVEHVFTDSLADCRNAGLNALRNDRRLGWVLAMDPDEWWPEPWPCCLSLRRMAEASSTWGWLFRFGNVRPAGSNEPAIASENVRMARLDPEGRCRWSGRVHEGFHAYLEDLHASGTHPHVRQTPFVTFNRGQALDDEAMEAKLRLYQQACIADLHDNPRNPGAWVTLGLQYRNDGRVEDYLICLDRAMRCARNAYMPFREGMAYHLLEARMLASEALDRLSPGHRLHGETREILAWLREHTAPIPLVGLARRGMPQPDACPPLPPFPDDAPKPEPVEEVAT